MSYVIAAQFRVLPGREEAFLTVMAEHAHRSRNEEPGCIAFDLCRDADDPAHFLLYEVYDDAEAYQAHRADPRHAAVIEAITPLVETRGGSLFWSRQVLNRVSG